VVNFIPNLSVVITDPASWICESYYRNKYDRTPISQLMEFSLQNDLQLLEQMDKEENQPNDEREKCKSFLKEYLAQVTYTLYGSYDPMCNRWFPRTE